MTKENLLTVRWNNLLSLVLGIPGLIYFAFALSSSNLSERDKLIGMAVFGVLY